MTPEKREQVLRTYKAGKMSSAAAIAKEHGVSRSAVYRLLTAEKRREELEEAKATGASSKEKLSSEEKVRTPVVVRRKEREREDSDDSDSESESDSESDSGSEQGAQVPNNFYFRVNKFADDLGLPESSRRTEMDEKHREDADEVEAKLDDAITGIMGPTSGSKDRDIDDILPPALRYTPIASKPSVVSMMPPPPPAFHQQERVDRQDLTQRILFNVEHFGPLLVGITGPDTQEFLRSLTRLSGGELKDLLNTLERTRSVKNMAAGLKQGFYVVAQLTEAGTKMAGMQTAGFAATLREQDQEISMILKEIALEQWERLKSFDSPQARLGMVQTDAKARMSAQLKRHATAPVNPSIIEATKDL